MSSKKKTFSSTYAGSWLVRFILKTVFFGAGIALCGAILLALAVSLVWPNLPDLKAMTDYRPRIPLRIYTADKLLLGEYGEERRNVLRIDEFPDSIKKAVLAAEDDNFYEHNGVNWSGVGRAVLANLTSGARMQGASTITMQVARNFYLSTEKSFVRKFYELLLTYKIEENLTKDQILEIYMNQIYLGHRSYGFSVAARTYFNVPLSQVSLAQAAVLAGIPKAPSTNNPKTNLRRAIARQHYVLGRMLKLKYITQEQYDAAIQEQIVVPNVRTADVDDEGNQFVRHGQYVAELVRQLMYNTYKDNVYGRGLKVYTTVDSKNQAWAYKAVREGLLNYTRKKPYPGAAGYVNLPEGIEQDREKIEVVLDQVQAQYPDSDDILTALVLSASANKVVVMRDANTIYELTGNSLNNAKRALNPNAPAARQIKRGSVVYIERIKDDKWSIINLPSVEGALVSLNAETGAITAMIGGFDYYRGDFNRAVQAWRQPGSTFKPFIYAAGLERGITPETNISDQPYFLSSRKTGGKPWQPKNYGDRYTFSQTFRNGLYQSRNMISIRVLEAVGEDFSREFITRFGFDLKNQPQKGAYLTMALGAGNVTPLQMASAYAVFANGGYRVDPYIIDYVTDVAGNEIMRAEPSLAGNQANRVLDPRTAYVMNDVLHGVATSGTAARITGVLKRPDLHGKTGTTNQSFDAWFAGYTPKVVGVVWMGFDQPTSLGSNETGGGVAMPIWLSYMNRALKNVPVVTAPPMPAGLIKVYNNYYFAEFPPGKAMENIGVYGVDPGTQINNDPVRKTIDSFNPLGGAPIRF